MPAAAPAPSPEARTVVALADERATARLAARVAALARAGDVIALSGPLGAGKTAFARAFVNALAARTGRPPEEVPSPTFTLVQTYDVGAAAPVHHFDLFRIARPDEAIELGFDDALAEGIVLIEWPERLGALLPADRLEIALALAPEENARTATVTARGSWRARFEGTRLDE